MLQIVHKFRELAFHSQRQQEAGWSCERKRKTPSCNKVPSKCPGPTRGQGDVASCSSGVTRRCCLIDETQRRLTRSRGGCLLSMAADSDTGSPGLRTFNEPAPRRPQWQEQRWDGGLNRLTSDIGVRQRTGLGSDTVQAFKPLQLVQIKGATTAFVRAATFSH